MSDKYLIEKSTLTALGDIVRAYNETPDKEYSLAEITAQLKESSENFYNLFENGIKLLESETATFLRMYAFNCMVFYSNQNTSEALKVNLPNVINIQSNALCYNSFANVYLPKLEDVWHNAFSNCRFLKSVYFPELKTIDQEAFHAAVAGQKVLYMPKLESIGSGALESAGTFFIILKTMPTLSAAPANWNRMRFIVPAGMKEQFTTDTNWSAVPSNNIIETSSYEDAATYWNKLISDGAITEEEARAYYD
jgi:hypothetical protein